MSSTSADIHLHKQQNEATFSKTKPLLTPSIPPSVTQVQMLWKKKTGYSFRYFSYMLLKCPLISLMFFSVKTSQKG